MRRGFIDGAEVFGVDYRICRRCQLGWVEEPATDPVYQRFGIAAAALAAIRSDNPGLEWHTLGGDMAEKFWQAAGEAVPGGYEQQETCPHVSVG